MEDEAFNRRSRSICWFNLSVSKEIEFISIGLSVLLATIDSKETIRSWMSQVSLRGFLSKIWESVASKHNTSWTHSCRNQFIQNRRRLKDPAKFALRISTEINGLLSSQVNFAALSRKASSTLLFYSLLFTNLSITILLF